MAGFYIGVVTDGDLVRSGYGFYLFRRHDKEISVCDGEEDLLAHLGRMRRDGDSFPAFDHFPKDHEFRDMDGARDLTDDEFRKIREVFIGD